MNQEMMQQEATAAGGGSSTGFATGTICTSSGTYRASNRYMDMVMVIAAGEAFPPFCDGKKTTWVALAPSLSSNKEGSWEAVKVPAGTI